MANSALSLSGIDAFYGDSHVLQKVSFQLGEGRLLGLLGRNGAGKSTCMNVSVGLLPPRAGSVEVFGTPVTRLPPELIAARGVALVPQGRRVFKSLTVRENLMVAAHAGFAGRRHAPWTAATVFAMFPRLAERRGQLAGYLSGGEQQMLAIGRALMANPRVLLMDEPSEGLAPQIVAEVMGDHPQVEGKRPLDRPGRAEPETRLRYRRRHRHSQLRPRRRGLDRRRAESRRRRSAPASRGVLNVLQIAELAVTMAAGWRALLDYRSGTGVGGLGVLPPRAFEPAGLPRRMPT